MSLSVESARIAVTDLHTRMPFSFGSVTITALPHVFVELEVGIEGETVTGVAADHAVPKWFEKNPKLSVADDVERMLGAVEHACDRSRDVTAGTAFDFWRRVHDAQMDWAEREGIPPLLASFGVSFVERAVIGAVCRNEATTFAEAVRNSAFGIEPGGVYEEAAGTDPADALPDAPNRSVAVRHTVGHDDPLTAEDVENPVDDGLPETLADYVHEDGVRYFKCKLAGDPARDRERLENIAAVLDDARDDYGVTLDANEQYGSIGALEEFWHEIGASPALETFVDNLICIEQPLDRDVALSPEAGEMLDGWNGPPIIVDESDGEMGAFGEAARLGYGGTSVKSCKGVFEAVVNACLAARLNERDDRRYLLTAEDLTTVGPVSLQQDLALVATLGFDHAERNGHHYFRGLTMLPETLQEQVLEDHGDLYHRHQQGFTTLDIDEGGLTLDSVVAAPYGTPIRPDLDEFTPVEEWSTDTLGL